MSSSRFFWLGSLACCKNQTPLSKIEHAVDQAQAIVCYDLQEWELHTSLPHNDNSISAAASATWSRSCALRLADEYDSGTGNPVVRPPTCAAYWVTVAGLACLVLSALLMLLWKWCSLAQPLLREGQRLLCWCLTLFEGRVGKQPNQTDRQTYR